MATVIAGFPGVGKTYMYNELKDKVKIIDCDSSEFSWIKEGVRHPDFPNNYIEHIKQNLNKQEFILVSSHDVVREALKEHEIDYVLVYPDKKLKNDYIEKYKKRGNDEGFINFVSKNWNDFINEIEKETHPELIKITFEDTHLMHMFNFSS